MNFGGGRAISEDMFQWIPRDFKQIADDLADTGCLVGNRIIENKTIKSNIFFSKCTSMVVHKMENGGRLVLGVGMGQRGESSNVGSSNESCYQHQYRDMTSL